MLQGIIGGVQDVMPSALATGLFVSLCTIQQHDGTFNSAGAPDQDPSHWPPILTNLRCMSAPEILIRVDAREMKSQEAELSVRPRHVLLEGYYPQITSTMRAVIDGVVMDILGAERDSQFTQTRIAVQEATV